MSSFYKVRVSNLLLLCFAGSDVTFNIYNTANCQGKPASSQSVPKTANCPTVGYYGYDALKCFNQPSNLRPAEK